MDSAVGSKPAVLHKTAVMGAIERNLELSIGQGGGGAGGGGGGFIDKQRMSVGR
jgi:hypothetical protein